MGELTNPELLRFLACPDCGGDLAEAESGLVCLSCKHLYGIRQGIPILYPTGVDIEHLRTEESLTRAMNSRPAGKEAEFNLSQWRLSKDEFWEMVSRKLAPPPGAIINVGCGYDSRFRQFEQSGYTFVNFDMVHAKLEKLSRDLQSKSCVAGDIGRLPFKPAAFDYVVCIDVIHHESEKSLEILTSFRDLLRPGGLLFLEDTNAWGMFQIGKSVLLPRPIYRFSRRIYHRLTRSVHAPADYEYPTSVWRIKRELAGLGFKDIEIHPNSAYPGVSRMAYRLYSLARGVEFVRKYHNYHYMLSAKRQ
jgi:SAM-dependent methyltransferase